jgi:hypothetical protein
MTASQARADAEGGLIRAGIEVLTAASSYRTTARLDHRSRSSRNRSGNGAVVAKTSVTVPDSA